MVQVIPQTSRSAGLGQALGGGISDALSFLAQTKAAEMAQRKQQSAQAAVFEELGMPSGLASLDPTVQKELFSQQGKEARMAQLLSMLSPEGGRTVEEESVSIPSGGGISDEKILAASLVDPQLARLLQSQKEAGQKREFEERKFGQKTRETAFAQTKDTRKAISEAAAGAQDDLKRLQRMQSLIEKGKLINPVFNETLKRFNLDLPALKNADSQEFDKLTVDFLRGARNIFGSRVTNFEVENFLKAIPGLSQSDEGKKRIIRNLSIMNEGALAKKQAMQDLIKENGGTPPLDLAEQIDDRIAPEMDRLAQKFLSGDRDNSPEVEIGVDEVVMIDPSGRRRKIPKKQAKEAIAEGYRLG